MDSCEMTLLIKEELHELESNCSNQHYEAVENYENPASSNEGDGDAESDKPPSAEDLNHRNVVLVPSIHSLDSKQIKADFGEEKNYLCNMCGKNFKHKKNAELHALDHISERPFPCIVCDRRFRLECQIKHHMKTHTNDRPYLCVICGKTFKGKHNLSDHMDIHTNFKPFKCDTCGKAFIREKSLRRHLVVHTDDKVYHCSVCGKGFKAEPNLKRHVALHKPLEEKAFVCDVCGKRFAHMGDFNSHKRIHLAVKPFKCHICQRGFAKMNTLTDHVRTHTKDKPYKCKMCGKGFRRLGHIKSHMVTQHGSPVGGQLFEFKSKSMKPFKADPVVKNELVDLFGGSPVRTASDSSGSMLLDVDKQVKTEVIDEYLEPCFTRAFIKSSSVASNKNVNQDVDDHFKAQSEGPFQQVLIKMESSEYVSEQSVSKCFFSTCE